MPVVRRIGAVYTATWTRPDGGRTVAVWSVSDEVPVKARVTGKASAVVDYLGRERSENPAAFRAGPGILYFTGDSNFSLEPLP